MFKAAAAAAFETDVPVLVVLLWGLRQTLNLLALRIHNTNRTRPSVALQPARYSTRPALDQHSTPPEREAGRFSVRRTPPPPHVC